MAEEDYMPDQKDRVTLYDAEVQQPQEKGFSITESLIGMGKFGLGMAVLGKVSNLGARSLYKNLVSKNAAFGAGLAKNIGTEVKALNMGGLYRGVRQTLAETPTNMYNLSTDSGKKMMEVLSSASKDSIAIGKKMGGAYNSLSNSKSFGIRTAAKIGRQFYKAAPIAAGWYGISRVMGLERSEDDPAWYNVPGHVAAVGKMTAEFAAFDIGIGGVKKLGGFAKNMASKYLSAEASPGLHAFLDKNFAITRTKDGAKAGTFLETVMKTAALMDGIRAGAKTGSNRIADSFMDSFGNKAARNQQRSNLFDFSNKAARRSLRLETQNSFKNAYRSRMDSLRNYRSDMGHDFVSSMNSMIAKNVGMEAGTLAQMLKGGDYSALANAKGIGNGYSLFHEVDKNFASALDRVMEKNTARSAKTMGATVLKRQTASVNDFFSDTDRTHANLMFKYLEEMTAESAGTNKLKENFFKMSAGPNIYKSSTGIIDYGMWNPKNMLSAMIGYVNPYLTLNTGFSNELSLVKALGMEQYLAKEGLGIHSIRANEGQHYYDRGREEMRQVGDDIKGAGDRLGGMLVDGELFITEADGFLRKADADKQHMVYATKYARESAIYKLSAEAYRNPETVANIKELESINGKKGMADRINNFSARWGLDLPSPIRWMMEGLNKVVGFSPMRTGVNKAIDLMLDPRNTDKSIGGDLTGILSAFGDMGNKASTALIRPLSEPRMLNIIGRLSRNVGSAAEDRVSAIKEAMMGKDSDVIDIIRKNGIFKDNDDLRYALEHYGHFANNGYTQQIGSKFSFRDRAPTQRQEINRNLLDEALGKQGLPGRAKDFNTHNIARDLLRDNEALSLLSKDDLSNLRILSTSVDLFHFGFLDGSGKIAADYGGENVKTEALSVIRKHLGTQRQVLESKLYDTKMIKDIGVLGFGRSEGDMSPFSESYLKSIEAERRQSKVQASPFIMLGEGTSHLGFAVNSFIDRVMQMGNHFGFKYGTEDRRPYTFKIPELFNKSVFGKQFVIGGGKGITVGGPLANMTKRIAQGVGVMAAAQALDTFTDLNPMFNGTMLDKGIYSAAADVYVKSSMAFHKVQDLTGITQAAKYLEGLMPSSTSTIPGMIIGGIAKGPLGMLPGAIINRFMDANGITPSFDKSYNEMKDMYSGRELVPVRRNRFWLFSKAPYEGDAPVYFRPHWYPRLKSQYKYTDTLYGSKGEAFLYAPWTGLGYNPIAQVLDKYHYEKKHYWDRPYPVSAPAFEGAFGVGPILASTIGRLPIIGKPVKSMHMDEMSHYYSTDSSNTDYVGELSKSNMPMESSTSQLQYMNKDNNSSATIAMGGAPDKVNPYGAMTILGEQLYNFTELAGLRGYQLESLMGGGLADDRSRYSTTSDMWSTRRAFWDMSAGDIFGSTEFFRRFVPRDKKIINKINPIRNKMASWLPSQEGDYFQDFLTGDPFTKIPEGEMRLPGSAYNRLYDVKRTFPGRASSLGKRVSDLVRSMTGLEGPDTEDEEDVMEAGTAMHRYIQDSMIRANVGYKAEQLVYDAKDDISGHIDLLMYDPYRKGGKRPLEIKTVNNKKFGNIKAPLPDHMSQLNFYLRQMQMDVGTLLYINRDDPTQIRTFDVRYSEERYRKDIKDLQKARKIAAGLMTEGKGFETGTSYSWLDRLRILADVAPYSKEYKDAAEIVKLEMRENKLTERDKEEVAKISQRRKSVMRKFDLYPTRFRGRVFNPDTNYELWSENTNIKAAANYSFSERVMGAVWERAIQMDTPLNTKLWSYKTPLQHYTSTKVYGTESATWNRPVQDFLKPMFTKALATNNPIDAAASFGWIGGLGMGGMGSMGIPGAIFGGMYGAAKAVVGNDGWIPEEMQKKREIERNFDQLKYMKAMNMYENTGDAKYQTEAMNTIWNISHTGYQVGVSQAMKSLSAFEKPYFLSWMKETNPIERQNIIEMVPEEVGNMLKAQWGESYNIQSPSKYESMIPNADWEGMMPNDNLSDIKVKTINQEGLRATDFGLGWYDQQRRMANSQFELNPVSSPSDVMSSNNYASKVKSALMRSLGSIARRPLIAVSITPTGEDSVKVNLNLMRDRFNDIKMALKAR